MMLECEYHPLADLFPRLEGELRKALIEEGRASRLLDPILLLEAKIFDGHYRNHACTVAGVQPCFANYEGADSNGPAMLLTLWLTNYFRSVYSQVKQPARVAPPP